MRAPLSHTLGWKPPWLAHVMLFCDGLCLGSSASLCLQGLLYRRGTEAQRKGKRSLRSGKAEAGQEEVSGMFLTG